MVERAALLTCGALVLWLGELVPPFVPTLALIAAVPIAFAPFGPSFNLPAVLGWAADPVLALFFGGFALGAAASRHRLDELFAERTLAWSGHRRRRLVALVMASTALLSMWMSNIAAAAMMLAALRPHLHQGERTESFRGALLLAVAMGANFGGMATPIGTGPNAIAIASLEPSGGISFVRWMSLTVPLMIGMLALGFVLIVRAHRVEGGYQPIDVRVERLRGRALGLVAVFCAAVLAWLTEPIHGIPAAIVSLGTASVLFGTGLLGREDLARIDWSTLLLIAGGIVLGKLADRSGLLQHVAQTVPWESIPTAARIACFIVAAATMGALLSNTASAAMLIPLAFGLGLPHSAAILIAIGTAMGVPLVISSPPNAMAFGEGGLRSGDLLRVGLPLMLIGCAVLAVSGSWFLRAAGIP